MEVIKCMSEDIEAILDMAEANIQSAIKFKDTEPIAAKAFYTKSINLMENIKTMHDSILEIIKNYRTVKGEPPEPMMQIYNYLHGRHINQAALIKNLQESYVKN